MATTAVRVALRVRPLLKDDQVISFIKDDDQIHIDNKSYTFDSIYTSSSTQEEVYKSSISPFLDTFIEGKNVTVLAYGQTGSGKTYSMGTGIETSTVDQGIIYRFANSLFEQMIEISSKSLGRNSFQISISYVEIENEEITDLLDTSVNVNSVNDLLSFLKKGNQRRNNALSSHSDVIFSITLNQYIINDDEDMISLVENDIPTITLESKIHFVDLAGSEIRPFKQQGLFINDNLGKVLSALSDESRRKNQSIPYKDSKLTKLLQDSLEYNSHVLIIACVSSYKKDYMETINTLEYMNEIRNIQPQEKDIHLQVNELREQITKLSNNNGYENEMKLLKQEMNDLKCFSEKISRELSQAQKERDTLILKLERPTINDLEIHPTSQVHTSILFNKSIDKNNSKRLPLLSTSSSRRLNTTNNKKKPVIHRMKSTHSSTLLKKKKTQATMDELLDLLRKEYLSIEEDSDTNEKSIDETVLHMSHETIEDFSNIKKIIPDNIEPILDNNDELEALSVPSWSDAPKSINGTSKRKSISLDSMWDDTDSSITTSRIASTTTHTMKSNNQISNSKSKDMKRQSRNLLKMLHQIQADLLVKRELVGQLEKSEDQYSQMKLNYEEKLTELKNHLFEIQNQRDEALKKLGTTIIIPDKTITTTIRPQSVLQLRENRQAQEVRSQYEVKLKRLITENSELRKKNIQSTQSIQLARSKAEGIIGRLRADIESLKMDKKQLNKALKIETDKSRELISTHEREVQQLKRRELIAIESKKKLEQMNEAQTQIIKKRTEETSAVNLQIRQLTNSLRKAANEGTFLNEVSLERLLNDIPFSSSPKNMRRPTSRILGNSSATSIE